MEDVYVVPSGMGRKKLARSTKTIMRAGCSSMSKGMRCKTARHIGMGAKAVSQCVSVMCEAESGRI